MDLDPLATTFVLVALVLGFVACAAVNPRNRGDRPLSDAGLRWGLAVVALVRYLAVTVLGVVVAAALLVLPGRAAPGGSAALEVVTLVVAAGAVVHTTLVTQALRRAEQR